MSPSRAVDRAVPPPPGEIRPFAFPPFARTTLGNGLSVLTARLPGVPLVSLELVLPAGGQYDPEPRRGLSTLTASVIDEGTAGRTSLEIAASVERLGGYITAGADWDVGYLATGTLTRHGAAGLELLAEILTSPTFPESELERLRRQRIAELLRRTQDPAALADERFSQEIYRGTAYAGSLLGSEETVSAITRDSMLDFYRRHYTLAGSFLIAVGDFDPADLLAEAEALFGRGGERRTPPSPPEIHPTRLPGISVHIVDRPGAAQTELRLGHAGVARTHPDYIPLTVMNTLLGGKFTSRINLNLRERHGFTYGATSRFVARQGPGPFYVGSAVATESTGAAAREVLAELSRIRRELVEPEELAETQSYMAGVFPYTLQTIGDVAKRLETLGVYGLPSDYFATYQESLSRVSREDVLQMAQRHIDPERMAVVAVGPAEVLEPQLAELGPVTVWSPQGETLRA
jgi:zinc protease